MPTRPVLSGRSRHPARSRVPAALSFTSQLRLASGGVLPPPLGHAAPRGRTPKRSEASKPLASVKEECPPGGVLGGRPSRRARRIRRTGRRADVVTEPGEFPVHPAVPQAGFSRTAAAPGPGSPGWSRAPWPIRIGPCAWDQAAVPGQQRSWRDEPLGSQRRWQQPGQRGQDRPVGPVRLRPGDLTPQHRHLVPEHHDLRILGRLAAARQREPAEHPDHDQVEQTESHEPRSWRMCLAGQAAGHRPRAEYWSGSGPIFTGRWISMARLSTSCCPPAVTWRPRGASSPRRCASARFPSRSRPPRARLPAGSRRAGPLRAAYRRAAREQPGRGRSRTAESPAPADARTETASLSADPRRRSCLRAEPAPWPLRHRHRRPQPPPAPRHIRRSRFRHLTSEAFE